MQPTIATCDADVGSCVALCAHCAAQRLGDSAIGAPARELDARGVVAGCCHDCGGGWCLCNGVLSCAYCPRRNSPVIVMGLALYRVEAPPPASTVPYPMGDESE